MASTTPIPLNDVSVIAAPSSPNATYSDPTSILHNSTWLLAENEPGYWTASFSFPFTPARLRLSNSDVNGSGTKVFSLTPQSTVGIANLSFVDPSTSEMVYCSRSCPMSSASSSGYQDFSFVNLISMNAFRLDITEWYGPAGGLKAIQLYGDSQASSAQFTSPSTASSASSTSTLITTSSASSRPVATSSPQASHGISGGAITGIVIGVVAAVCIAAASVIFWLRNSQRNGKPEERFLPLGGRHEVDANGISRARHREELGGHAVSELGTALPRQELEGSAVHELPGDKFSG